MLLKDAFKTSIRSLTHGKMRSILTMLGIVIGIASVIILMSIGASAQSLILNQVQGIGSNLIFIIPGGTTSGKFQSPASAQGIVIKSLKQRDIDSLSREISIAAVTAEVRGQSKVVYGDNDVTASYEGVFANFFEIRNFKTVKGYPFTQNDVQSFNHVAVIGQTLAKNLFGNFNPIGKYIRIANVSFRVIGVLEKKGTGPGGIDQDSIAIIPVSVAQKQMLGIDYFNFITAQANSEYTIEFAKSRIISVMRQNHGINDPNKDDFTVQTQEDVLSILDTVTSTLTLFLAAIASISLIVGGIGIMNIMLVSVTERTKEIGLRKAVGATDRDILEQFLIESVLLTILGGIIGISVGIVVVGAAYFIISAINPNLGWVFQFPLSSVILSLAVSAFAGIGFGIYPARQAAKKNPIEALRYE
jgi:putative ABC transport system permease protein